MLALLNEIGLAQKGERTQAQYYVLDSEGLAEYWSMLWEEKSGRELEVDPEFLEKYCSAYFRFNKSSTIKKMLVDDFVIGVKTFLEMESGPEWLEELSEDLGDNPEFQAPHEFVRFAVENAGHEE